MIWRGKTFSVAHVSCFHGYKIANTLSTLATSAPQALKPYKFTSVLTRLLAEIAEFRCSTPDTTFEKSSLREA